MRYTTSRIAIAAVMAAGVAVAVAGPAFADVTVKVDVTKNKTISVTEEIHKLKRVTVNLRVLAPLDGAAEAQALVNVVNAGNFVNLSGVDYSASMGADAANVGSVFNNTGLTQVNQAAGNMHNQGNLAVVALVDTGQAFVNSQAEVDQVNAPAALTQVGTSLVGFSIFSATIDGGSVSDNTGVTQVNQDAGNMNNQNNAVAVAAGISTNATDVLVALAEAALGQTSSNHFVNDFNNLKSATISGSVLNNTGVTHVNQAAGMYANQANVVSVGAAVATF